MYKHIARFYLIPLLCEHNNEYYPFKSKGTLLIKQQYIIIEQDHILIYLVYFFNDSISASDSF